ncbi:MAG: hypothetical protein Ct9H300mP14_07930 [Gammaproteobacteria bacterium]|nr:MAG: hypothetical protein Ct9H300mP14_07930 [Gammaproteobacteria bacterium]
MLPLDDPVRVKTPLGPSEPENVAPLALYRALRRISTDDRNDITPGRWRQRRLTPITDTTIQSLRLKE